jgi:hypothetical protein
MRQTRQPASTYRMIQQHDDSFMDLGVRYLQGASFWMPWQCLSAHSTAEVLAERSKACCRDIDLGDGVPDFAADFIHPDVVPASGAGDTNVL